MRLSISKRVPGFQEIEGLSAILLNKILTQVFSEHGTLRKYRLIRNYREIRYRLPSKKAKMGKVTKYIHRFRNIQTSYCGHDRRANRVHNTHGASKKHNRAENSERKEARQQSFINCIGNQEGPKALHGEG